MRKILLIAWREFKHTALTKTFIIGAVMMPLAIGGLMFVMPLLTRTTISPLHGTLAIVDAQGSEVTPAIERELTQEGLAELRRRKPDVRRMGAAPPRVEIQIESHNPEADLDALKDRVRSKELIGLIVLPAHGSANARPNGSFELFVASDASPHHTSLIQAAVASAIVRTRVEHSGLQLENIRSLLREPAADVKRLAAGGREDADAAELKMIIPIAFMMLLWISTFTSGNHLLTSTIEEKSNKVMEVLLSAVSPFQLMAGKILGHAAVSFIMLAMYAGVGLIGLAVAAKMDLIPPVLLLYMVIFFFMAFFMVAAIMAGVGSAVSEMRDAQSLITPAMLVLMVPLILWLPISNDPNGALATVTSFLPPLTPFVMILRVTAATEPVPLWQIIASIVTGAFWTVVMVWASAKIFRVGVLMYGKPPTPIELVRWVRYR